MKLKRSIYKKYGKLKGKKVAIFCGVHGNEKVGIQVMDYLINNLNIKRGVVFLVYANPLAIEKDVRYVNKNLNRLFVGNIKGDDYESRRARELIEVLSQCDALLDLHAYKEPYGESIPFAICEENCNKIVKKLSVSTIVNGLSNLEHGSTDGFMSRKGKIGICIELGSIEESEKFVQLGIKISKQFLRIFDCIDEEVEFNIDKQNFFNVYQIYKKKSDKFVFSKIYKTLDSVKKGEYLACDESNIVSSDVNGKILFPRMSNPIGVEAFILIEKKVSFFKKLFWWKY